MSNPLQKYNSSHDWDVLDSCGRMCCARFLLTVVCQTSAVSWIIRSLLTCQSRDQICWLTARLCPFRPTSGPSSLLLKYNSLEQWDVLDGCPSRGKCAVNQHLCSLVTVKILYFRCQHPDETSSHLAETGEAASSAVFFSAHGGKSVENMGWGGRCHAPPLLVR